MASTRKTVLSVVLLATAALLSAQEFPVNAAITTMTGNQQSPAVASNGSDHLAVWEDEHTDPVSVRCARVNSDGVVVDSNGPVLSTQEAHNPAVTYGGAHYLVVWEETQNGLRAIVSARVDADGTVHDPIVVASGTYNRTLPSVACANQTYLVVWEEEQSEIRIRGALKGVQGTHYLSQSGNGAHSRSKCNKRGSDF